MGYQNAYVAGGGINADFSHKKAQDVPYEGIDDMH